MHRSSPTATVHSSKTRSTFLGPNPQSLEPFVDLLPSFIGQHAIQRRIDGRAVCLQCFLLNRDRHSSSSHPIDGHSMNDLPQPSRECVSHLQLADSSESLDENILAQLLSFIQFPSRR